MKTTVEVYFKVEADDPDLVMRVIDVLNAGTKKVFGKRPVLTGTQNTPPPDNAVVIAPFNVQRMNE